MILTITLIFFFLYQPALKIFSNNFENTYIFQCLIMHFYFSRILSTNLYLTHDNVWYTLTHYTFSYRNIQVTKRIGIIFEPFIRDPCGAMPFSIWQWRINWNIQRQTC